MWYGSGLETECFSSQKATEVMWQNGIGDTNWLFPPPINALPMEIRLDTNNHKPALVRNYGCGSACKCDAGCGGCKMYPNFFFSGETTTTKTMIVRVAPQKGYFEGSEMNDGSENGGCNCGSNCTYDPCTCK
ncbi:metallothionein-like protein type 2 [Magnolia sinica]|uniref:metallothionein-like protein type 2 n=1 Tax=Magnolia sinica TaxID=86752 RepID=UPI0026585643|nr:metallothionein-like protein type 2 [Magnolia sinica]